MEWLPWQDASVAALATATATRVLPPRAGRRPRAALMRGAAAAWTRELTVMLGLYSLWQLAGSRSLANAAGAVRRGRDLLSLERWAHLPTEAATQHLVVADRWLLRACDFYYVGFHVAVTGACLIWLFACHRGCYPPVRNALAVSTGISLLVALVPVAPPRLIPAAGLTDTGHLVGPTVYPATPRPGLDQLSAMPSVHVGWAIIVAGALVYALRSRWRWLALGYPALTMWVVVVTGNHFWADGLAELLICAITLLGVRVWLPRCRGPTGATEDQRRLASSSASAAAAAAARRSAPVSSA